MEREEPNVKEVTDVMVQKLTDIIPWLKCRFGRTNYHLTQFLFGHDHFRFYLKKFGLFKENSCQSCINYGTPGHSVLVCHKWNLKRGELAVRLNGELNNCQLNNKELRSIEEIDRIEVLLAFGYYVQIKIAECQRKLM